MLGQKQSICTLENRYFQKHLYLKCKKQNKTIIRYYNDSKNIFVYVICGGNVSIYWIVIEESIKYWLSIMSNNIIYHYIIQEHCEHQLKSFGSQWFVVIPPNQ